MMTREQLLEEIEKTVLNKSGKFIKSKATEELIDNLIYYTDFFNSDRYSFLNIRYYFLYNNIKELKKCDNCKEYIKNIKSINDYIVKEYCSHKCVRTSPKTREKTRQTYLKKYGVDHPLKSNVVKEKIKQTNLERYGNEYAIASDEVQEKIKQTNLERYGVTSTLNVQDVREKIKQTNLKRYGNEYAIASDEVQEKIKQTNLEKYNIYYQFSSPEIQEKIKQTNLERYGYENPQNNKDVREKTKKTNLERYGNEYAISSDSVKEKIKKQNLEKYNVEYPLLSTEIQEKIKNTNLERYGNEYAIASDEVQEKIKQTNLEKYNVNYPLLSTKIQEKIKQSNLEKYGSDNVLSSQKIQEKIKQTNLEKYNVEYPLLSTEIQEKIKNTNIEKYGTPFSAQKHLKSETVEILNDKEKFAEFIKDKTAYEISNELGIHKNSFYKIINKYNTKDLHKRKSPSYLEVEMAEFLDELNIKYEVNNRTILNGLELDFYIPEHNLAIEMNGIYWHSNIFISDKNYHYNKWKWCSDLGINLISVFEDDWVCKKTKVKNIIKKFLVFNKKEISIRETNIQNIDTKLARPFLENYHLRGFADGIHYGAFDKINNLIAVMTFNFIQNNKFELSRFTMDEQEYTDLFSKLFKYAQNDLNFKEVVSFSENNYFTGDIYNKNGFELTDIIKPDYTYLIENKRIYREDFIKNYIKTNSILLNEPISEKNAENQIIYTLGIPKIYDCGKKKWTNIL